MLTHGLSDQGANGLPRLSPPYKGQLSLVWGFTPGVVNLNSRPSLLPSRDLCVTVPDGCSSSHPPARYACGGHPHAPGSGASPLCTPPFEGYASRPYELCKGLLKGEGTWGRVRGCGSEWVESRSCEDGRCHREALGPRADHRVERCVLHQASGDSSGPSLEQAVPRAEARDVAAALRRRDGHAVRRWLIAGRSSDARRVAANRAGRRASHRRPATRGRRRHSGGQLARGGGRRPALGRLWAIGRVVGLGESV